MISDLEILKNVIKAGESEKIEFKSSFSKECIETLVAFANSKGGDIIIGVDKVGKVIGTNIGAETCQEWINQVKNATSPSLIPDVASFEIDNRMIAVLSVAEFPIKPVSTKGRFYLRTKNSNHLMSITEISNAHLKTFNTSWDFYPDTIHSIKDISLSKVKNFISQANKFRESKIKDKPLQVLRKFELLKEGGISKAAFLLFMKNESCLSALELGRFSDPITIKDALTLKTDLFSEVEGVMDFIRKHISKAYVITGKPQRDEFWDYPLDGIREIVVNMIVHRDYADSSDSIIKIFDDRIEFFNPGNLPDGLTVDNLLSGNYRSQIRNKQIATVLKEIKLVEKYGSGIRRICEAFLENGNKIPVFENFQHGFSVTVFPRTAQKAGQKTGLETGQKTGQKNIDEEILSHLRTNPNLTIVGNYAPCLAKANQ